MSQHFKSIEKRLPALREWLEARGAQILTPTNEWEVLRFITNKGTSIIYKKKDGRLTFTAEAEVVLHAFLYNGAWRAAPATKRKLKSNPTCRALRERDGDNCFFCHQAVEVEDESPEHLVAITHGGPDHVANMVLAHRTCNAAAGHLSVMEKIRLREESATQVSGAFELHPLGPPWEL